MVRSGSEQPGLATETLIVGGGLAGMTLACALTSAGRPCLVIDREHPDDTVVPAFDGRVSAIAFAAWRLYQAIGVWDHVVDAQPILDIRVSDGPSLWHLHYDHRDIGDEPFGYIAENRRLRQAMQVWLAQNAPQCFIAPAQVAGVQPGPAGVTATLQDGREITAAIVAAADGRGSRLRESAGIKCRGWSYGQSGIVCTVEHEKPHHGCAQERFLGAGPFAILPMTGNRSSLVWTEQTETAIKIVEGDRNLFPAEMARRFGDFLGALTVTGPVWRYPLNLQLAHRYVGDRLALVGDAAHTIHPIAGQGLNLGIRDCAALAEVIVDQVRLGLDPGRPENLLRYQRWRRFDSLLMAGVTDGLNRLFSNDLAPLRLARDAGLAVVNRFNPAKRLFMRHARGTVGKLPRLLQGERL